MLEFTFSGYAETFQISTRQPPSYISDLIHWLYVRAGLLISSSSTRRYILRTHSLRKFFRTQLAFLGVDSDYIEYMIGHKISSYFDVKMRGIEYLRSIYLSSGMSIRPQSEERKMNALKQIIRSWGLNPEKILTPEGKDQSHTIAIESNRLENQCHALTIKFSRLSYSTRLLVLISIPLSGY